jgi:hypothetical protein
MGFKLIYKIIYTWLIRETSAEEFICDMTCLVFVLLKYDPILEEILILGMELLIKVNFNYAFLCISLYFDLRHIQLLFT